MDDERIWQSPAHAVASGGHRQWLGPVTVGGDETGMPRPVVSVAVAIRSFPSRRRYPTQARARCRPVRIRVRFYAQNGPWAGTPCVWTGGRRNRHPSPSIWCCDSAIIPPPLRCNRDTVAGRCRAALMTRGRCWIRIRTPRDTLPNAWTCVRPSRFGVSSDTIHSKSIGCTVLFRRATSRCHPKRILIECALWWHSRRTGDRGPHHRC